MDLDILIADTLNRNTTVNIEDVRLSIRNLYPDFNLDDLDSFHKYLLNNIQSFKDNKWSQYYKIMSHYKDGRGTYATVNYVSTFDLYCQMNSLYKSGNYYY